MHHSIAIDAITEKHETLAIQHLTEDIGNFP